MAHHIIKQPNGLYCIYSTVVDAFLIEDATRSDVIKSEQSDNIHLKKSHVKTVINNIIDLIDKGIDPYNGFPYDYETALKIHNRTIKDTE